MAARIDWPGLMRLGLVDLGLRPAEFWQLTPAELTFLATGGGRAAGGMTRTGLEALMARYPDTREEEH